MKFFKLATCYLLLATCYLLLAIFSSLTVAAQSDCDWTWSTCTSPWTYFEDNEYKAVYISSDPPCAVLVKASARWRCNEIEIIDYTVFHNGSDPIGCGTAQNISQAIVAGVIKEALYKVYASNRMITLTQDEACCPCPVGTKTIVSKTVKCSDIDLEWIGPEGQLYNEPYDPNLSWSSYQQIIASSYNFGIVPLSADIRFKVIPCEALACCFRTRNYCRMGDGTIVFQDEPWVIVGTGCNDPNQSNCTLNSCTE